MEQSFKPDTVDVDEPVRCDDLDTGQQEGRIGLCLSKALFDVLTRHADLVDNVAGRIAVKI